ncbi:MAG: hypothetical protein M0R77_02390 [Gammaproteobacteria bacterium]|nr:hypothetical protein [Gammaproteobacteria bacterium]
MGIRHLCDEKIKDDEFQYFIDNIGKFEVTEKVDGSNLSFGLDENGVLYMSRDKKDGRKPGRTIYEARHILGKHFAKYMEVIHSFVQTGAISMKAGTEVEIEIIDTPVTNVVPYDEHQMIVLCVESGSLSINTETIDVSNHGTWSFKMNRPYKIDYDAVQALFKQGLSRSEALVQMKKTLLDIPSQYGTNNPDSWIEGLVFKNGDMIYKLVNKDRFTIMNKFLHEIRKKLSAPKPGVASTGGIYQELISEIATHYSCGPLATSQKKRWVLSNPTWSQLISLNDSMFFNRNYIIIKAIVGKYLKMVNDMEDDYLSSYKSMFIETPYGKCYIDEYTHQRNLDAFSTAKDKIHFIDLCVESAAEKPNHSSIGLNALQGGYI